MIDNNLMERDLVIIGGGPGGYIAAIRAAQIGIRATIIEKDKIGGTCLNRGCIPTKAMYKNAEVLNSLSGINKFGVHLSGYSFDMASVQERKNNIVKQIRTGTEQLIKANKIEVIKGEARFINKSILEVPQPEGAAVRIKAENIIIAAGSVSPKMPEPGMDSPKVLSSDEALELDYVPKKMVIYGGGVIGVEFASIFASFGTEVTIIKYRPRLIRSLDEEVSKRLEVFFKEKRLALKQELK